MIRATLLVAAAALVLSACDFPPVPRGSESGIREGSWFSPVPGPDSGRRHTAVPETVEGAEPQRLGEQRELRGLLVGNAVSSFVIEGESGARTTVQVTPQTELRIGDQVAGLREIQPGSEVRATYVASEDGRVDLAVEIVADPESVGWSSRGRGGSQTSSP